jgi:hypothetical protein
MKIILLFIITLLSCTNNNNSLTNIKEEVKQEYNWQEGFGLTHNADKDSIWFKPVSYYIKDMQCSPLAIAFYYGKLKPSDNDSTANLLSLVITDNTKLRPFYRWCLNKTILIQDGALAEYTGIPARQYAEKFPKEFFEYMDIDSTEDKEIDWAHSITYSGFYEKDDYKENNKIQKRMSSTMNSNCKNCDSTVIKRIEKFTSECFK